LRDLGPTLAERLAGEGSRAAWRQVGEFLDDSRAADNSELLLSCRERPDECAPWWFVADLPGFVPTALRESPISFARRGIFITRGALERV
jgi:hypothetical protein